MQTSPKLSNWSMMTLYCISCSPKAGKGLDPCSEGNTMEETS